MADQAPPQAPPQAIRLIQTSFGPCRWHPVAFASDAELVKQGAQLAGPTLALVELGEADAAELLELLGMAKDRIEEDPARNRRHAELLERTPRYDPLPPIDLDVAKGADAVELARELAGQLSLELERVGLGRPAWWVTNERGGLHGHLDLSSCAGAPELLRAVLPLVQLAARAAGVPLISDHRSAANRPPVVLDDSLFNKAANGRGGVWRLPGTTKPDTDHRKQLAEPAICAQAPADAEAVAEAVEQLRAQLEREQLERQAQLERAQAAGQLELGGSLVERARRYMQTIEPAIGGSGGHHKTFHAAQVLVRGFSLADHDAEQLLGEYNARCSPPWSARELAHKLKSARAGGQMVYGSLRDAIDPVAVEYPDVDLGGILAEGAPAAPGGGQPPTEPPEPPDGPDDPGDFPRELLYVPGLIGQVVKLNLASAPRPQPVLALSGALCLLAVLAGRKIKDSMGTRTNVYVLNVAGSGSGKDWARTINQQLLEAADLAELEGAEEWASDTGLRREVEASPCVLFQVDEFGHVLAGMKPGRNGNVHLSAIPSLLMRLYSKAGGTYKGKAYADATRNIPIHQPCVTVLGTSVPSNLYDALCPANLIDGFVARLLIFEGDDTAQLQRSELPDELPAELVKLVKAWGDFQPGGDLALENPQPVTVEQDQAAVELLDGFKDKTELLRVEGAPVAQALWSRTWQTACKLALIYAASENGPPTGRRPLTIGKEAASWGASVAEYLTRRMLWLADEHVAENETESNHKRVLRLVREAGGYITPRDLARKMYWMERKARQELIKTLTEDARALCLVVVEQPDKPGRNPTYICLPGVRPDRASDG